MSDEAHYVRVGAFVFGGIALAVAGALVIGGGSLFHQPVVAETVFDESVQGLEVGSPLKLRGVRIGTVSYIGLVSDNYALDKSPNPEGEGNLVLVKMDIDRRGEVPRNRDELTALVEKFVTDGLRLRISPLGITGTSFIQADYVEHDAAPPIQISFEPEGIYLPSAPSTIAQLSSAAERLMSRIDKLNVEKLLTNFDTLLVSLNTSLGEADVQGARKSLGELLTDLRATSEEARKAIASADLKGVTREARASLDRLAGMLARVQRLLDANGDDFATTLDNLRVASDNLREASETARAYPSLLLFGTQPKPIEAPSK